jgi:integrase
VGRPRVRVHRSYRAASRSRADKREWAELLKEADVREARLHDARHTAATVLLVLVIHQRAVMGLMGWSNNAMTTRYQHLTPDLRRYIARQVDELLWTPCWTDETGDATWTITGRGNGDLEPKDF